MCNLQDHILLLSILIALILSLLILPPLPLVSSRIYIKKRERHTYRQVDEQIEKTERQKREGENVDR